MRLHCLGTGGPKEGTNTLGRCISNGCNLLVTAQECPPVGAEQMEEWAGLASTDGELRERAR